MRRSVLVAFGLQFSAMMILTPFPWVLASSLVTGQSGEILGQFAGITRVRSLSAYQAGLFLILPSSEVVPVTFAGEVAFPEELHFSREGCEGDIYFAPAIDANALLYPFPGGLVRSPKSAELLYAPVSAVAVTRRVASTLQFSDRGVNCVDKRRELSLLPLQPASKLQEHALSKVYDQRLELQPVRRGRTGLSVGALTRLASPVEDAKLTVDMLSAGASRESECSPSCLQSSVGNGICDAECYVASCSFDGMDCTEEDQTSLQSRLAEMCSPGCELVEVGDGFCDAACNTEACGYDESDCE